MNPKPVGINRSIWAFGVWIHTRSYRYISLAIGPIWIYLFHEAWFLGRRTCGERPKGQLPKRRGEKGIRSRK